MHLLFLGTAAAEGYPGLYCSCENCREARALGGKNLRMRSALLVNTDLLIDFGPDVLAASLRFGADLSLVRTGLVTHTHEDHFDPFNFKLRAPTFTARLAIPTLTLFGSLDVPAALAASKLDLALLKVEPHAVAAFDSWSHAGYTFRAFEARHGVGQLPQLTCLFYAISDGQRSVLYATDTGDFPDATWQALAGCQFDAIVLEETLGSGDYGNHLDMRRFIAHVRRFRAEGMLKPGARIIAHHLSHAWNPVHAKVEAVLGPEGVEVAYDGMRVEL
jgi:phosphoribosyl 1,2-cyclic phosphate phosphodiesterase